MLTLLCVLFPLFAGGALLIGRPAERKTRNRFALAAVLLSAALVIAAGALSALRGPEAAAVTVARLSKHLVIAFRPDGVSLVFGAILAVLWPVTTVYAFSYMEHEGRENLFFGFFVMTFGVVAGIAYAANFFTLYLCYELMTLVTLPLVMHGMDGRARYAGKLYILYSMTGAALAFVCLMFFCRYADSLDFVYGGILHPALIAGRERTLRAVFVLAFFGFGVKAAIFPFYRWLPAASVAPTPVTALLHAVAVVKSGAFAVMRLIYFGFGAGFLRGTGAELVVMSAAAVTVLFGSSMALRTPHLKRRLAYSTVSNLSYILLGFASMNPAGLAGGLLHMIYHAAVKISLFFCAGAILHRNRLEYVYDMEGLAKKMPVTCGCFLLSSLALMGIPPLGGFLSKWSIAVAAAQNGHWGGVLGAASLGASAVLTGLYMLTAAVRFYFPTKGARLVDDAAREADGLMLGPLLFLAVLILALSLLSGPLTAWIGGLV